MRVCVWVKTCGIKCYKCMFVAFLVSSFVEKNENNHNSAFNSKLLVDTEDLVTLNV